MKLCVWGSYLAQTVACVWGSLEILTRAELFVPSLHKDRLLPTGGRRFRQACGLGIRRIRLHFCWGLWLGTPHSLVTDFYEHHCCPPTALALRTDPAGTVTVAPEDTSTTDKLAVVPLPVIAMTVPRTLTESPTPKYCPLKFTAVCAESAGCEGLFMSLAAAWNVADVHAVSHVRTARLPVPD